MKFINFHQYDYKNHIGEVNEEPSETIPDQSMSISELIHRFASGLPMDGERVPFYENEDDEYFGMAPNIERMDRVDILMMQKDNEMEVAELRRRAADEKRSKKKDEQGSSSERTSGEGADQGPTAAPAQNPISEKNPVGPAQPGAGPAEGQNLQK